MRYWVVAIALFVLVGLAVSHSDSPENAARREEVNRCGDRISAAVMAEQFVKDQIKTPATAKFPWGVGDTVMLECGRYRVRSYVDAQNSFGALVRTKYEAVVVHKGGKTWGLQSLTFDD